MLQYDSIHFTKKFDKSHIFSPVRPRKKIAAEPLNGVFSSGGMFSPGRWVRSAAPVGCESRIFLEKDVDPIQS